MRNIVDLLWHPGFNNSLDAGDFLHGSHYPEELVATYLQLNKKVQIWVLLSRTTSSLPTTWRTKSSRRTPCSVLFIAVSNTKYIDNEMSILLYLNISTRLSSVHPWSMMYASSVWSPLKIIEGAQSRATRLSRDLRNEPYNIKLTTLGLPTLQFRRDRAGMLQVFKILNRYEDIDSSRFFTLSSTGLRGYSLFLFQYSAGPF